MKTFLILMSAMLFAVGGMSAASATYDLESKDGRTISVTDVRFDGETIKAKRSDSGQSIILPPSALSPDSWAALNASVTARVGLGIRMTPIKQPGADAFANAKNQFTVRVTSSTHFSKATTIACYYLDGPTGSVETYEATVSAASPFETVMGNGTAESASVSLPGSSGGKAVVVVAENADGSICEMYSSVPSVESAVRAFYDSRVQ